MPTHEYRDRDLFTPDQAKAECRKCPGLCSTGCRFFMATHTEAQRTATLRRENKEIGDAELKRRMEAA